MPQRSARRASKHGQRFLRKSNRVRNIRAGLQGVTQARKRNEKPERCEQRSITTRTSRGNPPTQMNHPRPQETAEGLHARIPCEGCSLCAVHNPKAGILRRGSGNTTRSTGLDGNPSNDLTEGGGPSASASSWLPETQPEKPCPEKPACGSQPQHTHRRPKWCRGDMGGAQQRGDRTVPRLGETRNAPKNPYIGGAAATGRRGYGEGERGGRRRGGREGEERGGSKALIKFGHGPPWVGSGGRGEATDRVFRARRRPK